mmetsp:Transcript_15366/g.33600  ORF Transcript_15366/g.33600 Transcript_15366/m.33600 type:complete len:100 (+) Transcript_15366:344-643(+)
MWPGICFHSCFGPPAKGSLWHPASTRPNTPENKKRRSKGLPPTMCDPIMEHSMGPVEDHKKTASSSAPAKITFNHIRDAAVCVNKQEQPRLANSSQITL